MTGEADGPPVKVGTPFPIWGGQPSVPLVSLAAFY